jgi:hypothetical protein
VTVVMAFLHLLQELLLHGLVVEVAVGLMLALLVLVVLVAEVMVALTARQQQVW